MSYDETSYSYPGDAPLSTKLYLTLRHLNALAKFVNGLADYNLTKSTDRITIPFSAYMQNISSTDKKIEWVANTTKGICINLKNMTKEFHHYLKGVAVKELHAELVKPNLSDKQQLESFEALLATGKTKAILYKNRQSINERELKFLSFISILVGIGIFTTLGLAFKRLYDTGGRSVNFFKPLSQELFENASQVLNESLHSHNKSA